MFGLRPTAPHLDFTIRDRAGHGRLSLNFRSSLES